MAALAEHEAATPESRAAFAARVRTVDVGRALAPHVPTRTPLSEIRVPRRQTNMNAVRFVLRLTDAIWLFALITAGVWQAYIGTNDNAVIAPIAAGLLGAASWLITMRALRVHAFPPTQSQGRHLGLTVMASFAAVGAWLTIALLVRPDTFLPGALAQAGLFATLGILVLHAVYWRAVNRRRMRGELTPTIVMLGATESARRLIEANARSRDLNIAAIFDDRLSRTPADIHGVPVVGQVADLLDWDALPYIDRIVVTLPGAAKFRKAEFVTTVRRLPNRIAFISDDYETLNHVEQRLSQIAEVSIREHTGQPKSGRHTALKRMTDVALASTALVLGAPVLGLIALAIKLDSPGPIIFRQPRHGFNSRVFDCLKFRSLRVEDECRDASTQVIAGDRRVTRVGRFIRKTSLDELPQLINVLRGDMSLVGPRPHAVGMRTGEVESYKLVEEYAHRHKVKPGMTGWAQINGSRGPLHDAESVSRRVALDVEYIERSSLWLDLVIMAKTIPCLLGDADNVR